VSAAQETPVPFLSVVVPTGQVGEQALRETLLCLVGQDDTDLEVLLVVPEGDEATTEGVLADQPPRLAGRVRTVSASGATPGAVRNAALDAATGRYVTVLPEGDLALGSWVATFHRAEPRAAGRVLRALGVRQEHVLDEVAGRPAVRAEGSPRSQSPVMFSLWQHALEPLSPPPSWAFPRALATEEGLRYDEDITDDADWEMMMRLAERVGVADLGVVTSVHREWRPAGEPRRKAKASEATRPDVHPFDGPLDDLLEEPRLPATADGERTAQSVIDARPIVIPVGEAARLRAGSTQTAIIRHHREKLELKREQLKLTKNHAANLEGMVRHLERLVAQLKDKVEHTEQRLAKGERRHAKEVKRLRRQLEAATGAQPEAAPRDADERSARGWRGLRRGR
jgi:hypothetical protein